MNSTQSDIDDALEILDGMPEEDVDRLRRMIAEIEARLRVQAPVKGLLADAAMPGWSPVSIAVFFVLWSSNDASLLRSL
jgi:hypothetical protein